MGEDCPSELQRYANHTTIHGIKDFVSSKSKVLKVIWGMFLLAAACFLCEEIYRTVKNYHTEPTSFDVKFVDMDSFPTIHVCMNDWFDGTKARSLGFQDQDLAYLCWYFLPAFALQCYTFSNLYYGALDITENFTAVETSIRDKMDKNNLTSVSDVLNQITWNINVTISTLGDVIYTMEWSPWYDFRSSGRVCYSVSNLAFKDEDGGNYKIIIPRLFSGVLVVGEDPFGPQTYKFHNSELTGVASYGVNIWDFNKLTLLSKRRDYCNNDYGPRKICQFDCLIVWAKCSCNLTSTVTFPYNNEDFWFLKLYKKNFADCYRATSLSQHSCDRDYQICQQNCNPCVVWSYQYKVDELKYTFETNSTELHISVGTKMKVSLEYYTYPASSLVSNIGGLLGLFCGASLLSFVQAVVFWFDDGLRSIKVKTMHGQKTAQN